MLIKRCIVCQEVLKTKGYLCHSCSVMLDKDRFDSFARRCPDCFYPLADSIYVCSHCKEVRDFPVFSICDYSAPFPRRILENYKFLGEKKLCRFFAYEFSKALESGLNEKNKDNLLIVPVPSSSVSLLRRGWDQMEEIAGVLKRKYGYHCSNLIALNEDFAKEQKSLHKSERKKSVQSKYVFKADEMNVIDVNKTVVLIDDVTTTGSTLNACRKVLQDNGFSRIKAATWMAEL